MFSAMNRGREHNRLFGYEINTPKDTVVNIRETQEFVINMVSDSVVDAMNASSENVPSEVNEFELAGVTPAECEKIAVPRVLEAPCSLECRLWQEIPLPGDDGIESTMIIGQVLGTHIKDEYILDDKLDISKFTMIGRLGYRDYSKVNEQSMFKMTRPDNYSKGSW
jgi:flavin reductase (DIM6/NTAB) family NADH-FMN oxidoreductase RutF